jgi:RNA 3'-terminal phosphate cyclase (ATP)
MKPTVPIDGSQGEGGGQILRTSLSLSALTGRPLTIRNIRAGRSKPGLQPQHLSSVRAAAALCAASLQGADVGSTELTFTPMAPPSPGQYHFEIGTAGAATLVLQTVLLPLALAGADSVVTVSGGTHVPHAPTFEYLAGVYGATLRQHGLADDFRMTTAGFYPRGGGVIHAQIPSIAELAPVDLRERGPLVSLMAYVVTARLPEDVAERGVSALQKHLPKVPAPLVIERHEVVSQGPGAAVILIAEHEQGRAGFSAVGARGKPMEVVMAEACAAYHSWYATGLACDEHLADQLALPMALVPGESRWMTCCVTEHLRTVLTVIAKFLPVQAEIKERSDGAGEVILQGVSPASLQDEPS